MVKKKVQFSPHIYQEWGELFKSLTDAQKSEVLMGITMYPNYEPQNCPVWSFVKSQLNNQYDEFLSRCDKNKQISVSYWSKKKTNDTERIPNDTERYPKLEQELEQEQEVKETTKEKEKHYSEAFLIAWNKYPKRRIGNKDKAYSAWNKVIKDKRFTEEFLVKAVENYAVSEDATKDDGKWAKGFVAWLNDDRFKQYFSCVEENEEIESLSEMEKYKRGLIPLPPQKEDKWEGFDMFGDKLWGNNK